MFGNVFSAGRIATSVCYIITYTLYVNEIYVLAIIKNSMKDSYLLMKFDASHF